jgi:hypothetical protein
MPYITSSSEDKRTGILDKFQAKAMDVFNAILELDKASSINDKSRKDGGVVYTPRHLAMQMCELSTPKLTHTIFEPSCGRGVFVFALAEYFLKSNPPEIVHISMATKLWACDIDHDATADLSILWEIFWKQNGVSEPLPIQVACEDSLFGEFSKLSFDLAIGNPPYVRFKNLSTDYRTKLRNTFPTCAKGNFDLYFAFIEKSLSQCEHTCFIFPNSWLSSRSGKELRVLLAPRTIKLADFCAQLVFAPVRAYVCIILASKNPRAATEPIRLQTDGLNLNAAWTDIQLNDSRISPLHWTISSKTTKAVVGKTLGDIATLFSGIATLADSSYAINDSTNDSKFVKFTDPMLLKQISIPIEFAPKKIKLTKVHTEADLIHWNERIVFPYKNESSLVPFKDIEANHSELAEFLNIRKERLALRDKGVQDDYPEWHAYGRKQGLKKLPETELCAVPTMSQGAIQCFSFDAKKTGRFLFTSGFILAPKPGHTCAEIIKALSSPASWQWALAHGKPWAGADGKTYRSYGARLLLTLPLPH